MRPARALSLTLLGSLMALPAAAEEVIFKCHFDWACDPDRGKCENAKEDIRFKVDVEANTVARLGGASLSEFSLVLGDRAISILETPISGGVTTTTVRISDGAALHSSHAIEGITLNPMQYMGECITF